MMPAELVGKRVMVVEDEWLVAILLKDVLIDAGCIVIGPFARVSEALVAAESDLVDVALLDVNIAGETSFVVAEALERRSVPFLFLTGYGETAIPDDRPTWEAFGKPFMPDKLADRLARKLMVE